MLIQSIYKDLKKYSKLNSVSREEAEVTLSKFGKDLTLFKTRLSLIESLEINVKEFIKDPDMEGYLKLTTKKEILDYVLNLKNLSASFKVTFKNGNKYHYINLSTKSYTTNYDRIVVNFLLNYI